MKKYLLLIIYNVSLIAFCSAQNPLVKQWDKRFGGTNDDRTFSIQETNDDGFIIGGSSNSDSSGDKTQNPWGYYDYWIVKTDSLGIVQWDKDFGGTDEEIFYSLQQTMDGGYILGGQSESGIGGDKSQNTWGGTGDRDYWIVKIDSLGNKQWDKDFGGTGGEEFYSLQQTTDKGYILGGYSFSGISGDKTQTSWGDRDFWVVKIDSLGNKEWDKDFGGADGDYLFSLEQTTDGGYILGGWSFSGISGNKTESSWGYSDYWIVKTDSLGNKEWDKRFGGTGYEILYSLKQTGDGGYILGGYSSSGISGDKTQNIWGNYDYWIVKIDSLGNKQWDKDYGGILTDYLLKIVLTNDGGFLLIGDSYSPQSGNKTENNLGQMQGWIVKTDSSGNIQWDKTIFTTGDNWSVSAVQTGGCYTIASGSESGIGGYKTQPNWDTTNQTSDYWIIKFCDTTSTTSITQLPDNPNTFSIYPNPAKEYVTINYQFKAGDEIRLTDVLGKLLFTTKIKTPSSDFRLPTSDLSTGIYFLKAGNEVRKFVKE